MIRFKFGHHSNKVLECIDLANDILNDDFAQSIDSYFYDDIASKASFDMSTASPEYISDNIYRERLNINCEVELYRKRWSKANAYFIASKPNTIHLNTAKLGRSEASIVGTLIHEFIHMVDAKDEEHSYGHGSNSRKGKQNTAPYWIGNLAASIVSGKTDFNNTESSKIIYKKTFWQKVKSFFRRVF